MEGSNQNECLSTKKSINNSITLQFVVRPLCVDVCRINHDFSPILRDVSQAVADAILAYDGLPFRFVCIVPVLFVYV